MTTLRLLFLLLLRSPDLSSSFLLIPPSAPSIPGHASAARVAPRRGPAFSHRRRTCSGLWRAATAASSDDDGSEPDAAAPRGEGTAPTEANSEGSGLGDFEPQKKIPMKREVLVGDPQQRVLKEKEMSVTSILKELAAIQQQGPQKYCVLGTRHCSYLHQQIIELLAYALVLSENHVYTSGAAGTHAATIRGALRAERPDLLTVVLPQSMDRQPPEIQDLLKDVTDLITMPQNDEMTLDVASRICNSYLLSQTDQLISFAFHESETVIEATKEAKKLDMLVTTLFLD